MTLPIENNICSKYTTVAKQCTYNEWEKLVDICSNALKGVRVEITTSPQIGNLYSYVRLRRSFFCLVSVIRVGILSLVHLNPLTFLL